MIELKLNQEAMNAMYFDDIKGGKSAFGTSRENMIAQVTEQEFDSFLKTNNLITYRNTLKGYEDGEVYGEYNLS
jgi:hypothetical protein